jgi:hypothetical protein
MPADATRIPKFLTKIHDILDNNDYPQALQWNREGSAMLIHSSTELEKILPCVFKHKNVTSFIRQLNLYGFKKMKSNTSQHAYYHEFFKSTKTNLLQFIKRKKDEVAEDYSPLTGGNSGTEEEAERRETLRENEKLKKVQLTLSERICVLESQLEQFAQQNLLLTQIAMKKENEITSLKGLISTRVSDENGAYLLEVKTIEAASYPLKKFISTNGAFKPIGEFQPASKHSFLSFDCQNSAFAKVKRSRSLQDGESSDSDRKSEKSTAQSSLLEEQRGGSPIHV